MLAAWRREQDLVRANPPATAARLISGQPAGSAATNKVLNDINAGAYYIRRPVIPIRAGSDGNWDIGIYSIAMPASSVTTEMSTSWYRVTAEHSGKVMDVQSKSTSDSAKIVQYPWEGGTNQQFQFRYNGDGTHHIVPRHVQKVLDISGASPARGAKVILYSWRNVANQRFQLIKVGYDRYLIISHHCGLCLEVDGNSQKNSAQLTQYSINGGLNQIWRIERV